MYDRTGARPRRGRGGARRRVNERPQKTAADLDAEMEVRYSSLDCSPQTQLRRIQDYTASNAPAAAA